MFDATFNGVDLLVLAMLAVAALVAVWTVRRGQRMRQVPEYGSARSPVDWSVDEHWLVDNRLLAPPEATFTHQMNDWRNWAHRLVDEAAARRRRRFDREFRVRV